MLNDYSNLGLLTKAFVQKVVLKAMKVLPGWKKDITFQVGKEWYIQTLLGEHCFMCKNSHYLHIASTFGAMVIIWID